MAGAHRQGFASARKAAGFTQEGLAEALYVDRSTVIRWEAGQNAPVPYLWPKLARTLGVSADRLQLLLATDGPDEQALPAGFVSACGWLDEHAGWRPGTARRKVADRRGKLDLGAVGERNIRRARVPRSDMVHALTLYYGGEDLYRVRCEGREVVTSVATRREWLAAPPASSRLDRTGDARDVALDAVGAKAGAERLAESLELGVRLTDAPIYRLRDISDGLVFGLASFAEYALTADPLEAELLDAVRCGGTMPLRDRYLPGRALEFVHRLCVGGVACVTAIARPAAGRRREPDYVLLVQQRSARVLNATGRLAVIPKGFHQPLSDPRGDVAIEETVRRELEEELFARVEVDNTLDEPRAADPMHPARMSAPMRWLTEREALRIEPTGFGINLVSGNYEFATLAVIDDERFWSQFGGVIEANWEAAGLLQYSTRDRVGLADLISDESWSNEGLFALLEGLRFLASEGGERVELPLIE